jgi:predicted nucleic-acid-binding protein
VIGLDTNVLVRYLVEDDLDQSERAAKLIDGAIDENQLLFVSSVVLCEVVWVLQGPYKVSRARVVSLLEALLKVSQLKLESRDVVANAVARFSRGKGDFADYVIHEAAKLAGCSGVATFDKALLREDGFLAP